MAVDIKVSVDTKAVVKLTTEVLRQLPYALNDSITRTAKEAVTAAQREASEHLQIRKHFLLGRIRILSYSRVANLTAVIGVDAHVQGSPLILGFLEEGQSGEKKSVVGEDVAVPLTGSAARPAFPEKVTPKLLYKRLQITASGVTQWKGKQRTFVIPGIGIFQRISSSPKTGRRGKSFSGAGGSRLDESTSAALIYAFKPSAHLGPHVRLREAMLQIIGERFAPIFTEEFRKEILQRASHLANK